MSEVEILIEKKIPKGAVIIEGFQGVGLVGTLAAQYMSDKLEAKQIGYINSDTLSPMALLVNGEIKHPMRIYHFKKKEQDFLIFDSELPIPHKLANAIAKKIAEFAKRIQVKEIVSLEGIATPQPPEISKVFYVSNMPARMKKISKYANELQNGIIIGTSAALLIQAKVKKLPTYALMAESHSQFPDGVAASELVKTLSKIYGLNIDVSALVKESKAFEDRVMQVVEKVKEVKESEGVPKKTYIG